MKVATWNVNGIRARQLQVQEWIEREQPEVVCLQEIKAAPDQVPALLCELQGYWCYWHGSKGYSGVALFVRKEFCAERPEFTHPDFDFENRIVVARINGISIASIYVPNGGKDFPAKMRFWESMNEFASGYAKVGEPLVLCGDLNVARAEIDVHPKERNPRVTGQRPEERALFEQILQTGMVDLGRAFDPDNEGMFTWWAPWRSMRQRNIGWRLDYVLASAQLAERAVSCSVESQVGTSDHAPVVATFEW